MFRLAPFSPSVPTVSQRCLFPSVDQTSRRLSSLLVTLSLRSYSLVNQSSCRFYFEQLAAADFSRFSPALSYKQAELFANARSCLVSPTVIFDPCVLRDSLPDCNQASSTT